MDFDFELPEELIAQQPPAERGQSRMLVMDRATGEFRDSKFQELATLLHEGDLLVLNDSRVIPARLYARRTLVRERERPTGRIEVMLTARQPAKIVGARWCALGEKVANGERLVFPGPNGETLLEADVLERGEFGERLLEFAPTGDFCGVGADWPHATAALHSSRRCRRRPRALPDGVRTGTRVPLPHLRRDCTLHPGCLRRLRRGELRLRA